MRLHCRSVFAGVVFATAIVAHAPISAIAQAPLKVPAVPVERYQLPNGLTVLLSENHSAPVVAVDVWYHVGSKNDQSGHAGVAHLFERLMAQGSQNVPAGVHVRTIEAAGGELHQQVTPDRSSFSQLIPSNYLETALWLESDRMGFLVPALDQAKLDMERGIAQNEYRRRFENAPYGAAEPAILAALYSTGHPYAHPTIGVPRELSAVTLKDVKDFAGTYYVPGNATLAIVGDFDPAQAKALVTKYFGQLTGGRAATQPTAAASPLSAEKRLVLEDPTTSIPRLTIAWPTVGVAQSDAIALHLLANVLGGDRASRLTQTLVYDRQLATDVSVEQRSAESGGYFQITVWPRSNASLTDIEHIIDSTLTGLTSAPSAQELVHARGSAILDTTLALDGALHRAEVLLYGEMFRHDPLAYLKVIDAEQAVTPSDVARVAKQYLTAGRVVLSMVPAGKLDAVAKPQAAYTKVSPPAVPSTADASARPRAAQ